MENTGLVTCSGLLLTDCGAKSAGEVIGLLAEKARERGFVEPPFLHKLLERESAYPTGLAMEVPMAIPHVHDGCLRSFFGMAVMREPVAFEAMDGSETVLAELVFLFGITDPSQQTAVLRRFAQVFQNASLLERLRDARGSDGLARVLAEAFGDYIVLTTDLEVKG